MIGLIGIGPGDIQQHIRVEQGHSSLRVSFWIWRGFRTGSGFAASAVEPIWNDHIAGAALAKGFKPSRKLVDLLVGKFLNRGFNLCDATHEGSEYSCR